MSFTKSSISKFSLTIVCAAVLAACGGGGGNTPSSASTETPSSTATGTTLEHLTNVVSQVRNLPETANLTVNDTANVAKAAADYNKLSEENKRLFPAASLAKLKADVAAVDSNLKTAQAISAAIGSLPVSSEIDTAGEKGEVTAVRGQYDALSDGQKTWVDAQALAKLLGVENDIARDKLLASEFEQTVAALPSDAALKKSDAAAVQAQEKNYAGLNPAQKSYVTASTTQALAERQQAVAANEASAQAINSGITALPEDPYTAEDKMKEIKASYEALTANQQTWVANDDKKTIAGWILDTQSLDPLPSNTPLHTAFISSSGAQQHNPHMQLRMVDGEPALVDTQIGLIRSLVISPNDPVIVDGAVLSSNNAVGYLTPHSASTKASSAGNTKENIKDLIGVRHDVESNVKTSLDDEIKKDFEALAAAKKVLKDPEADMEARLEAQEELDKLQPIYDQKMHRRAVMEAQVNTTLEDLAYIKKDKNGLVFDKAFDGVYVIQFENGVQVVIHDPAAAGWTYQTFAHYIDRSNGVLRGYQSLGDETTVAQMPASGTATYKGITTAYLNNQQVTANVNAVADFAKKGVRFTTSDSQIHTLNGGVRTSTAADKLNMSGTASWAAGENAFKGNVATADKALSGTFNGKFYGASAAEIGGTYGLKNADNSQQLIGGYGAKR